METRARRTRSWFVVLVSTLLSVLGCHMVFGDFEEEPNPGVTSGVCTKGGYRCKDEFLLSCNADLTGWMTKDTCASKEQCNSTSGACLVCPQADAVRCNGARLEACSSDRTEWKLKMLCPSAETCGPGGCAPCTNPGELQCTVTADTNQWAIRKCTDGQWIPASDCPNEQACRTVLAKTQSSSSLWDGQCKFICTPGEFRCDGVNLQRCVNGTEWMQQAVCNSAALCDRTRANIPNDPTAASMIEKCDPGCGTAGMLRCREGKYLDRCSDDQLDWQNLRECPAGMQCTTQGSGDCVVCNPGDYQCNGSSLERCGDDHVWTQVSDCKTSALCRVQNDPNTGKSMGSCDTPACTRAGDNVCGTDSDPKTPGSTLWECKSDLTGFVKGLACETAELCHATDKACALPLCKAGSRRCNTQNLLQVQECNPGETAWNNVVTCKTGEFCDANDTAQPCKHDCPAPLLCNDHTLQTCSAATGVVDKAQCDTKELCTCAVAGNCPAGTKTDGCGVAVCGGTLAGFRCTDSTGTATSGPILQQCKTSRDGWNKVSDCGAANLCYPGVSPTFAAGYCATCPVANEVACMGSATQVCAADRKSWTGQTSCNYGCVDSGMTDYCAQCFVGEKRCMNTNELHVCSTDQKSLPLQTNCGSAGCRDNGNNDYCATCSVGETRCAGTAPGSKLQVCNAAQNGLTDMSTCANGCFDNGTADYCGECKPGDSECSGTGVHTCGTNGKWGAVTACTGGGPCVDSGNADYCGGCSLNELRCTGATLQKCSADQKTLTTVMACGSDGCVDSGMTDYCAACQGGETRCVAGNLQQCSTDRKSLSAAQTCGSAGCIDSGITDYCAVCAVGETRCNAAALQSCAADQKSLTTLQTCANGCFDSGTADYCGECKPGDQRCSGTAGGMQICGADGRWPTTISMTCQNGCFGTAPAAYCGVCKPGVDTQCGTCTAGSTNCPNGTYIQSCTATGQWSTTPTASSACSANGCIDSANSDFCAECPLNGAMCVTSTTRQTCVNGHWSAAAACQAPNPVCLGTSCVACTPTDTVCDTNATYQTCSSAGAWGASTPCTTGACLGKACVECLPNSVKCTSTTQAKTCDMTAHWGTPANCPSLSCINDSCTPCAPGTRQCSTMGDSVMVCGSNGTWGATPTPCPFGCNDMGTADDCQPCAVGTSVCGTGMLSTCAVGGYTTSACTNCVDSGDHDYCGECSPTGPPACTDTTHYHACGTDSRWLPAVDCGATSQVCLNGACVACTPGDAMCEADGVNRRVCSSTGTWGDPTPCPTTCNATTKMCN